MSLSNLSFGIPRDGWVELKLDNDSYYLSYTTPVGKDFLQGATYNFSHGVLRPTVIIADGEDKGTYYFIFEFGELTVCHTDEDWCKHYYFGSAFNLLCKIYFELEGLQDYWLKNMHENLDEVLEETKKHICPMDQGIRNEVLQKLKKY